LDRRVQRAAALVDALIELTRLLGDGVVHQLSWSRRADNRALLGIASTILRRDVGRAVRIRPEDFQIIDRTFRANLGRPRPCRGGETFQASLALALRTLVELAAAPGGRLSSLFLRERLRDS
jgi:hypothetical protein